MGKHKYTAQDAVKAALVLQAFCKLDCQFCPFYIHTHKRSGQVFDCRFEPMPPADWDFEESDLDRQ